MGTCHSSPSSLSSPSQCNADGFDIIRNEESGIALAPDEDQPAIAGTSKPGAEGLSELGFEYRLVLCEDHADDGRSTAREPGSGNSCFGCATRLFHASSGTMITAVNRRNCIPDGRSFDEVSRVCQEVAQERVARERSLKFVNVFPDDARGEPVRALVDADGCEDSGPRLKSRPTFLFITGKGKSRAGVVSVKEVIISGVEKGSALFHLERAQNCGLATVCLDPNAMGEERGMEVIDRSLTALFESWEDAPVYILAHSAAGGYLVRYLLLGAARERLLPHIRAIAFTDSTHRLPWARDDPPLFSLLQSPRCLYVRNDAARTSAVAFGGDKAKAEPGEDADVDMWWRQRFGELRTVWAGTVEHSAMCWIARGIIWDFLDSHAAE